MTEPIDSGLFVSSHDDLMRIAAENPMSISPELPRGLPDDYTPPREVIVSAMAQRPFGLDGKPMHVPKSRLLICSSSVAYSFRDGKWNAQALCEGTEGRQ